MLERVGEHSTDVVVLRFERVEPEPTSSSPADSELRELAELEKVLGVPPPEILGPARILRAVRARSSRIVSSIQKRSLGMAQQALVNKRLQGVEFGVADLLGGLQRAAAAEDGRAGEELLLLRREQVVAPLDRRPQSLLARVGVAAAPEQIEPLREPLEDLRRRQHAVRAAASSTARGRLSSRVTELAAISSRSVKVGAGAEELDRLVLRQRRHRVLDFALDRAAAPGS